MSQCDFCVYGETCPLAYYVNFCEDCKHYDDCDILSECEGGHHVECNNGFEEKTPFDEDEVEEDEEE